MVQPAEAMDEPDDLEHARDAELSYIENARQCATSVRTAEDVSKLLDVTIHVAPPGARITKGLRAVISELDKRQDVSLLTHLVNSEVARHWFHIDDIGERICAALLRAHLSLPQAPNFTSTLVEVIDTARLHGIRTSGQLKGIVTRGYMANGQPVPPQVANLLDEDGDPSLSGPLYPSVLLRFVIERRKNRPLRMVLPEVLSLIPSMVMGRTIAQPWELLVGALIGKDIYKPEDVEYIASQLNTTASVTAWHQAIRNALEVPDAKGAANIVDHVYTSRSDIQLRHAAIASVIASLMRFERLEVPDTSAVQLSLHIFRSQLSRVPKIDDIFLPRYFLLAIALMGYPGIPNRHSWVKIIIQLHERYTIPFGMAATLTTRPVLKNVFLAAESHSSAVASLLSASDVTEAQFKEAFERIVDFRYRDATSLSPELLEKVIEYATSKSWLLVDNLFSTFTHGLRHSTYYLLSGNEVHNRLDPTSSHPPIRQHLDRIVHAARELEKLCVTKYPHSWSLRLSAMLCPVYDAAKSYSDLVRHKSMMLAGFPTNENDDFAIAKSLLRTTSSYEELKKTWRIVYPVIRDRDTAQRQYIIDKYIKRLLHFKMYDRATKQALALLDDEEHGSHASSTVARLLLQIESPVLQNRILHAFPRICANYQTQVMFTRGREHRLRNHVFVSSFKFPKHGTD
ncbi:hypothetical protein BKA62DRAFT_768544 [Auriculariales sp. MPI-PUGE-AT-0066]|nr:hypothetical protein BKA62DRAFT_768544 [Auriculariales sp. MPI-PUGE-AT-0066]